MAYEKQESSLWLPTDKKETLEGEVVDITDGVYGKQYAVKTEDESIMTTPSHKFLQSRMLAVKVGDKIKVVFIGEEKPKETGQNPMKTYDVFIDR